MKLVAMLRIKNQILTLHQCFKKLTQLVDEIVIVDNGSIDGTLSAYKHYPKIVAIKKTKGFHEGRDKILAHQLAKQRRPDWILWIDADEIFEASTTRSQLNQYMADPHLNKIDFRMFNFWKSKTHYRVDGIWHRYTAFPQRHLWRHLKSTYFRNLRFHNGGIMGIHSGHIISPIRLKHYGYITTKQIHTKQKTYAQLKNDPRAFKTLPPNEDHLKLHKWRSFKHPTAHHLWQQYTKHYWKMHMLNYHLKQALKSA